MISTVGYGISESLLSIFDGLRQATRFGEDEAEAQKKYHDTDIDKVAQYICCRNYGFVCRELCFLSWAVNHAYPDELYQEPLYRYFWLDGVSSASGFRQAFAVDWQADTHSVTMKDNFLHIRLGNTQFDISPTRAGILAVMMEFVATVDPTMVQQLKGLQHGTISAIDDLSKVIQKTLYDYLKDHLPEAQEHNRYRYVADWLSSAALSPEAVNDATILTFWQQANDDPSPSKPSHIRFDTAVDDMLDTLFALKVVQQQKAGRVGERLGGDKELGEIDLERIPGVQNGSDDGPGMACSSLFNGLQGDICLAALTKFPKCINQSQQVLAGPLVRHRSQLNRFTQTFMRLQVFSPWQAVLSQAKRKSVQMVAEKLQSVPENGYVLYAETLADTLADIQSARACLLHALLPLTPQFVLAELIEALPNPEAAVTAWLLSDVAGSTAKELQTLITEAALRWPALRIVLDSNARKFKQNNKAGFKTLPEEDEQDAYLLAHSHIVSLELLLSNHLATINALSEKNDAAQNFASDISIFKGRFENMYGEVHVA